MKKLSIWLAALIVTLNVGAAYANDAEAVVVEETATDEVASVETDEDAAE